MSRLEIAALELEPHEAQSCLPGSSTAQKYIARGAPTLLGKQVLNTQSCPLELPMARLKAIFCAVREEGGQGGDCQLFFSQIQKLLTLTFLAVELFLSGKFDEGQTNFPESFILPNPTITVRMRTGMIQEFAKVQRQRQTILITNLTSINKNS